MKKALALVMAIAMVASMAAVSFAATLFDPQDDTTKPAAPAPFLPTIEVLREEGGVKSWVVLNDNDPDTSDDVIFGETVYVWLAGADGNKITEADAVKGLTVSAKWTKGSQYVKSVEIVKEKNTKEYAIAIATTGSSLETVNVVGELAIKGKSYFYDATEKKTYSKTIKDDVAIELDLAFAPKKLAANATELVLEDKDEYVVDFSKVEETKDFEVDFGGKVLVNADVKNMKKVYFAYNDDASEELLDAYVDANLDFYNCAGTFRRTAEVTIVVEEGSYLYEVVDGALVAVDGEYDEWTEEFTFKTRTMGNYVVSDVELVVEEVVATNPSTGAAA